MRTEGEVLNRGHVAKCSSGPTFNNPHGVVERSLEEADAGASSEYFEIIGLN